jgi:hypothetical protein
LKSEERRGEEGKERDRKRDEKRKGKEMRGERYIAN